MDKTPDYERLLIQYMAECAPQLPADLLKAVNSGSRVVLHFGDIELMLKNTGDLFYWNMRRQHINTKKVVVLRSITGPIIAYDPLTGREVSNNLSAYGIKDRRSILPNMRLDFASDAGYLRSKGLEDLADEELRFVERLSTLAYSS